MTFTDRREAEGGVERSLRDRQTHMHVKPRSLMVFSGSIRYDYAHGIASRKTDKVT